MFLGPRLPEGTGVRACAVELWRPDSPESSLTWRDLNSFLECSRLLPVRPHPSTVTESKCLLLWFSWTIEKTQTK